MSGSWVCVVGLVRLKHRHRYLEVILDGLSRLRTVWWRSLVWITLMIILAFSANALVRTRNSILKALAVLLLALALLATASFEVLGLVFLDILLKGLRVSLQDLFDCLSSNFRVDLSVSAFFAVATALRTTHGFVSHAFAVQLEAPSILTPTSSGNLSSCLSCCKVLLLS